MSEDKAKLIEKLAKLKAHAESAKEIGNEAEAETFATKLQELLLRHKLSLSDVEYAREMKDESIVEKSPEVEFKDEAFIGVRTKKRVFVYKDAPDVEVTRNRAYWSETLASVVASAYKCDLLVIPRSSRVIFVGHATNVEIAEYLFVVLLRAASNMSWRAYGENYRACQREGRVEDNRGFRESWLVAFVHRIAQRLRTERVKIEDEFRAQGSENALMRLDRELVQVKKYMEKYGEPKVSSPKFSVTNAAGLRAGRDAADRVNLKPNAMKKGSTEETKQLGH